ncbi:MAG: PH domain-containing protein [Treponema sp.]|jgi:membrane protein YdbS with pleckstrin-like domain|nr:PH domain-containing protein [Treponema sp.]
MKFVRKKNLQENEEILHLPSLHWFYTVKYMVLSLPIFVILLIVWALAEDYAEAGWFPGITTGDDLRYVISYAFLAAVLAVLVVFICRIFQYLCVQYGVTNKRLIIKKGVLRIFTTEIPIDRIETVNCIQGLFGMMFNYGTIRVSGIGGSMPVFRMVCRPYALRRKIVAIIEKNKAITVVHGELPKIKPPEPVVQEPLYRYGTFVKVLKT